MRNNSITCVLRRSSVFISIIFLISVVIVLPSSAYAVSGGGSLKKYSFDDDFSNEENRPSSQSSSSSKPSSSSNVSSSVSSEDEIISWLTRSISDFHSPSSVRVIEVLGKKDDKYYITISAQNLGGGTSKDLYELEESDCKKSRFVTEKSIKDKPLSIRTQVYGSVPKVDIGEISAALREYCTSMGWN